MVLTGLFQESHVNKNYFCSYLQTVGQRSHILVAFEPAKEAVCFFFCRADRLVFGVGTTVVRLHNEMCSVRSLFLFADQTFYVRRDRRGRAGTGGSFVLMQLFEKQRRQHRVRSLSICHAQTAFRFPEVSLLVPNTFSAPR